MFLNLIKNFFLKKNTQPIYKLDAKKSNEIAVIINVESVANTALLEKKIREELFTNRKLIFYFFKENIEKNDIEKTEYISNRSFNWRAKPVDEKVLDFVKKPFLLCIVFSKQNKYINKMVSSVNAQYKFEISDTRSEIFDVSLIYSMSENSDYIDQLKNYLKSFNII